MLCPSAASSKCFQSNVEWDRYPGQFSDGLSSYGLCNNGLHKSCHSAQVILPVNIVMADIVMAYIVIAVSAGQVIIPRAQSPSRPSHRPVPPIAKPQCLLHHVLHTHASRMISHVPHISHVCPALAYVCRIHFQSMLNVFHNYV